jgi:hypothetical protein
MSKRSIAKAGELSARVGNVRLRTPPHQNTIGSCDGLALWDQAHGLPHITFSHVMVRVLIVPVSGSTDGVVDR